VVFAAVAADSHSGDTFKLSAETTAWPDLPLSSGRGKVPRTAAADSNQRALLTLSDVNTTLYDRLLSILAVAAAGWTGLDSRSAMRSL
jgi:hypothetical protein